MMFSENDRVMPPWLEGSPEPDVMENMVIEMTETLGDDMSLCSSSFEKEEAMSLNTSTETTTSSSPEVYIHQAQGIILASSSFSPPPAVTRTGVPPIQQHCTGRSQ